VQQISERVSADERELLIKRSTSDGRVTFLTRAYGRGTDFICRNQQLLANGGVTVLQTFFSEELAEEYQIMGRSARQGDRGSFRMVLLDKELEWALGSTWEDVLNRTTRSDIYKHLNAARADIYESKCGAKGLNIEQCKNEHSQSREFMKALGSDDMPCIKEFLLKQNKGADIRSGCSRTIVLMDATGSMSPLLSAVKDTVCTMFERCSKILAEKELPSDSFEMQFVVYRDYDCGVSQILESSAWQSKPTNLRAFIEKIRAHGGGDREEAIEIGLWHAVNESQASEISQVILIGNAPAKDRDVILADRNSYGGESKWAKSRFGAPTYYNDELKKLDERNIPVHAFYLHECARENFRQIAKTTGGRFERLDIKSPKGADLLTNFVTEELLRMSAGSQGEEAVNLYRKRYVKLSYTS
jgi:hypothetical protein